MMFVRMRSCWSGGACTQGLGSLQEEGHRETHRGTGGHKVEIGGEAPSLETPRTTKSPRSCRRWGGSSPEPPEVESVNPVVRATRGLVLRHSGPPKPWHPLSLGRRGPRMGVCRPEAQKQAGFGVPVRVTRGFLLNCLTLLPQTKGCLRARRREISPVKTRSPWRGPPLPVGAQCGLRPSFYLFGGAVHRVHVLRGRVPALRSPVFTPSCFRPSPAPPDPFAVSWWCLFQKLPGLGSPRAALSPWPLLRDSCSSWLRGRRWGGL